MALTVKNIVVESPYIMSELSKPPFIVLYNNIDASPIYLTLSVEVSVSGSYTEGDFDYVYSGGYTSDTIERQAISDMDYAIIGGDSNIIRTDRSGSVTQLDIAVVGDRDYTKFVATLGGVFGKNGNVPPFSPPFFDFGGLLDGYFDISITDNSEDPPVTTDTAGLASILIYFEGLIEDGDLELRCNVSGAQIVLADCSTWGSLEFRDIRGTYSGTADDLNGISYTIEVTIG